MNLLSEILHHPLTPLAHIKVVGVYEQGAIALKGKTGKATLLMHIQIPLRYLRHALSLSDLQATLEDLFHRWPAHLSVRATQASQRHLSPSCPPYVALRPHIFEEVNLLGSGE